ncbi:hydroxyisourate hydrolase [uncultured Halopseudomonas sp.]|uniref:hydroxyisourate hydrolase n=1 Tax=uncultured Halopseudomonas sp. TaxID=2901193 RepID=UPI0030ED09BA|tara:strand:+ start:915 stop:1325 length:411 start_codon:yes stop_codon:yes gene_type:complete
MTFIPRVTLALLLSSMAGIALAADNPLSVHVLNLESGLPSPEVRVTLEQLQPAGWQSLNEAFTNQAGRIPALFPADKSLQRGTYRVTFKTGDWFAMHQEQTFFPEVPVIFDVDGEVDHYHIPLLLSPYGYSTYRGN